MGDAVSALKRKRSRIKCLNTAPNRNEIRINTLK